MNLCTVVGRVSTVRHHASATLMVADACTIQHHGVPDNSLCCRHLGGMHSFVDTLRAAVGHVEELITIMVIKLLDSQHPPAS